MSTERVVPERRSWRQTAADIKEISRLLNAGERLLSKSGSLRGEPLLHSQRSCEGHHSRIMMERKQGRVLDENGELPESARSTRHMTDRERQGKNGPHAHEAEKLIPGIPDDVALNHILTKVGWSKLASLSSVSPAWRDVINDRELYNARLRNGSAQIFLAMVHKTPRINSSNRSRELTFRDFIARFYDDCEPHLAPEYHLAISLYNVEADSWHLLPPIPQVNSGIPPMSACVSVAGRLYVLGGEGQKNMRCTPRKSVFMIDLVMGHGVWKKCASMSCGRSDFACGVIDGKIYVAGGWSNLDHVWIQGEVFDPERNSWQRIADMPTPRLNYTVGILDKELYLIGGSVFHSFSDLDSDDRSDDEGAEWADVYNPCKNQWRRMKTIGGDHKATWLVSNNELLSLHSDSIDVYDKLSQSWRRLTTNSWEVLESAGAMFCSACSAADINGELFAFVRWLKGWPYEITLLKAGEFARRSEVEEKKFSRPIWKAVTCPHEFNRDFFFLVPVKV